MKHEQIKSAVAKSPWFQGVDDDALTQIAENSQLKRFDKGEFLYSLGQERSTLYGVVSGHVRISMVYKSGGEFTLTTMKPGDWFGEASLLRKKSDVLEARADTELELIILSVASVEAVANTTPVIYRNLFESHLRRNTWLYRLMGVTLFLPLNARVAARMLHLIHMFGDKQPEGVYLDTRLSQADLARMSMGSRQRVNKVLREWNQQGMIDKLEGRYLIRDVEALTSVYESAVEGYDPSETQLDL